MDFLLYFISPSYMYHKNSWPLGHEFNNFGQRHYLLNTILIFTIYLQKKRFRLSILPMLFFTKLHGHRDGDDEFTSSLSVPPDVTQQFWRRLIQQLQLQKTVQLLKDTIPHLSEYASNQIVMKSLIMVPVLGYFL